MNTIKNLLALLGLVSLVGVIYALLNFGNDISTVTSMAPETKSTYSTMWAKLKATGNAADATVWRVPLEQGVSADDAEQAMEIVANEANIRGVGVLPLSEQVELQTGIKQRYLKIFQYCDPETAMKMVAYSDAFAAYLPCRISIVEGEDGQLALYSLNMDLMIYGGDPLPEELYNEAVRVKEIIQKIMSSGASGDFF